MSKKTIARLEQKFKDLKTYQRREERARGDADKVRKLAREQLYIEKKQVLADAEIPAALSMVKDILRKHVIGNRVVYFLIEGQTIVYVGTTQNLGMRIDSHHKDKEFDSVLFIEVARDELALKLEQEFIHKLAPKYNRAHPKIAITGMIDHLFEQRAET